MTRKLAVTLVMVLAVVALPRPNAAFALSGDGRLSQARALFDKGDIGAASDMLEKITPSLERKEEIFNARVLMGMIQLARGAKRLALDEFAKAAMAAPGKVPAARDYPPRVIHMFRQARAGAVGSALIRTNPPEAQVYVDREYKGLTPVRLDNLAVGRHSVKITRAGYRFEERKIDIAPAEVAAYHLSLTEDDGQPPVIIHKPVASARVGGALRVRAKVDDNTGVSEVILYHRKTGGPDYTTSPMFQVSRGVFEGSAPRLYAEGAQYYIKAIDISGNISTDASRAAPHNVSVTEVDTQPPLLSHTPVARCSDETRLTLIAKAIDNEKIMGVTLFVKRGGEKKYQALEMKNTRAGVYEAVVPEIFMSPGELDYYINAADITGNVQSSGWAGAPHVLTIFNVTPFYEGVVATREDKKGRELIVTSSSAGGPFEKDQTLAVVRATEKIMDPETGVVIAVTQRLVGKIKITVPGDVFSRGKIVKEYGKLSIRRGDLVRSAPGAPSGLRVVSSGASGDLTVMWNQSPEPEVSGYLLFRAVSADGPFEELGRRISGRESVKYVDKSSRKNRLAPGQTYFYKLKAYNDDKHLSVFSAPARVTLRIGPAPVENLEAVSGLIRKVKLVWRRSADDKSVVGYKVYRSDSMLGVYTQIADLQDPGATSYTDRNNPPAHEVSDGVRYWYKLASYDMDNRLGVFTDPVSAVTRGKPSPPEKLTLIASSVRSIAFGWSLHPDPDVVKYRIYRSGSKNGDFKLVEEISGRAVVEYTDTGESNLSDGKTYFYYVTAVNRGGAESDRSSIISGYTLGPPTAPGSLRLTSGMARSVRIEWEPVADQDVTSYSVYRGESPDALRRIARLNGRDVAKYVDNGEWERRLEGRKEYYYTVRSVNTVGVESRAGEILSAMPKNGPAPPVGFSATQGLKGRTTLTWSPNKEPDIEGYRVLRATPDSREFRVIALVKDEIYEDLFLDHGATYYYRIQAVDHDGLIGDRSETIAVSTRRIPTAPTGLGASAGMSSVTLSWRERRGIDIDHYVIYMVDEAGRKKVGQSVKPYYIVEYLEPGVSYTFTVTAVDSLGLESAPSPASRVTTLK